METKPVTNYKTPNYPRIEVVLSHPDLLMKNMPQKWKTNKVIVTAMVSFTLSAYSGESDSKPGIPLHEHVWRDKKNPSDLENQNASDSAHIAPIFVHGEGVGASGCVMIAPPVYLSEAEARNIIQAELDKEGISIEDKFKGDNLIIKTKKVVYNWEGKKDEFRYKDTLEEKKYIPDAFNQKMNLVIEFVSMEDFENYADREPEMSSVSSYDIKSTAVKIREALVKEGKTNAVVFYDPVGYSDRGDMENWEEMEKSARKNAVEQLKTQVADFIDWIKKEGLLKK